jgi:hypothetical protein
MTVAAFGLIPRWAFKPRTVYKAMKVFSNGTIYSPHRHHRYTLGELNTSKFSYTKQRRFSRDISLGLHVFLTYQDAKDECDRLKDEVISFYDPAHLGYTYEVFECTIPKGAKYYKGIWEYSIRFLTREIPNIVSNRLIINTPATNPAKKYEGLLTMGSLAGMFETHLS